MSKTERVIRPKIPRSRALQSARQQQRLRALGACAVVLSFFGLLLVSLSQLT